MRIAYCHTIHDEKLGIPVMHDIECELECSVEFDEGCPVVSIDAVYIDGQTGDKALGQLMVGTEFVDYGYEPGEWVKVMLPATTAQEGFGGAHIPIFMEDGSEIILRGPWHVGAPEGYVEVSYQMRGERWGGRAGLYITIDLFTRIMARFQAHLELVEVTYGGCTTIEPMKPEWGEPKRLVYEREWLARKAAREAAKDAA